MSFTFRSISLLVLLAGCSAVDAREVSLRHFPVDDVAGIVAQSSVVFDAATSSDGHGSAKIEAREPMTVRLYDAEGLDVEKARLIYRAKVRTAEVEGRVFLEMWCRFPGQGEYFSRALDQALTGTVDWTTLEAPFILQAGQIPDLVQLNIVIDGTGTVWIDDIDLVRTGL